MQKILCSCTTAPQLLAGRHISNGINYNRDEVIWASHICYVFTGKAVSAALREVPHLAAMNLRSTGIYLRTETGIVAVHLRSLKPSVTHLACPGFIPVNTGVYIHLRHLVNVEFEPRDKRASVQCAGQIEWVCVSRRQVPLVRKILGLPGRS